MGVRLGSESGSGSVVRDQGSGFVARSRAGICSSSLSAQAAATGVLVTGAAGAQQPLVGRAMPPASLPATPPGLVAVRVRVRVRVRVS